ncbi:MAG: hypothetical protein ABIL16_03420 [candidate division WOR-3 bacterium]
MRNKTQNITKTTSITKILSRKIFSPHRTFSPLIISAMRFIPILIIGLIVGCSSLPPKGGAPDVLEVRFKSPKDSIVSKFKAVVYNNKYAVATYSVDEGIIETDWRELNKSSFSCCFAYMFEGVRQSWIKVIAYVGQVPGDTLNYIKLQGLLKIIGTRPWDNEVQIRPIKKGTPYYKELEKLITQLEEQLGEKGNYEAMKREVLLK